jgi:hypothetical protein
MGVLFRQAIDSKNLFSTGILIDMLVSVDRVASELITNLNHKIPDSISVRGLLDTGCTITSIDQGLVEKLGLSVRGFATTQTAAGPMTSSLYSVQIDFQNSNLKGKPVHQVQAIKLPNQAFQVLIGRDLMQSWVINYNGSAGFFSISD